MNVKYIVGRPLMVGKDSLEPGDELSKTQVESINNLDAYLASRRIFRVLSEKEIDRLPTYLQRVILTKQQVKDELARRNGEAVGTLDEAEASYEAHLTGESTQLALQQAEQQEIIYAARSNANDNPDAPAEESTDETPTEPVAQVNGEVATTLPEGTTQEQLAEYAALIESGSTEEEAQAAVWPEEAEEEPVEGNAAAETPAESDETAEEASEEAEAVSEAPEAEKSTPDDIEGFDPAEYSVANVNEYIESHPEEKDAILSAEAKGKARKGILEA